MRCGTPWKACDAPVLVRSISLPLDDGYRSEPMAGADPGLIRGLINKVAGAGGVCPDSALLAFGISIADFFPNDTSSAAPRTRAGQRSAHEYSLSRIGGPGRRGRHLHVSRAGTHKLVDAFLIPAQYSYALRLEGAEKPGVSALQVLSLDHVNIRTADVERLANFYRDALGFEAARHPVAVRPTVWLGQAGSFHIHLVEGELADANESPRIEHFALRATGLASLLERLSSLGIPHRMSSAEGLVRVNLRDPDGNRLHLDFDVEDATS